MRRLLMKLAGKDSHAEEVRAAVSETSERLLRASIAAPQSVLVDLGADPEGLSQEEAERRLETYGRNEFAHETSPPWYRQFLGAFINPFVGILIGLALASFVTEYLLAPAGEGDLAAVVIIGILVVISVVLTFIQEFQANRAADELLSLVQSTTTVQRRERGRCRLITAELVPGDIVFLSAGDIIPADVRILAANNLSVNEAALTGESLPVEKDERATTGDEALDEQTYLDTTSALDIHNIGFTGTNVVSGTARAVVIATGNRTYLGSMSEELVGHHPPTSFDRGIGSVSRMLIRFMFIMVPIIFLASGILQGNWLQALLFALAVAVGLTPEMLPTIVSANLAKGTVEMARRKTIVKRLSAIQNLGAMDVLCTDKTGTLTHDTVAMARYVNVQGNTDLGVLKYTYLNSHHQTGLTNPLDEAVLAHREVRALEPVLGEYSKVEEIPFETTRRRMSVIVDDGTGDHVLICKGAVDEMLSISSAARVGSDRVPLDDGLREGVSRLAAELNEDGLRVLLVAHRRIDEQKTKYRTADERDMTLEGLIGFLDPPKETAGPAIAALNGQNIRVCVVTGDNAIATRRICRDIDLDITGMIEGHEIDRMTDEVLSRAVEMNNVFVRTAPLQKSRILNSLKANGHTVGFLGDGINDAPALRDSDVGISVDNAVDIAKESAEIILLQKDLMILSEGVGRGRLVFGNIMKYIKMAVSSNFGNVFSVLIASIMIPFAPMLPLHLLIQNLLYDISQLSIPWDTVDEDYLTRPRRWNPGSIVRFTLHIGPVSSIFDFSTFALLWFVFGANTGAQQSFFHTGWFVLGLLSQTMIVHMIRTRKIPFIQSTAAPPVVIMTALVMLVGLVLPFTAFGEAVGFVALPAPYFGWLAVTLIAYFVVMQAVKTWYIRRFDMWL